MRPVPRFTYKFSDYLKFYAWITNPAYHSPTYRDLPVSLTATAHINAPYSGKTAIRVKIIGQYTSNCIRVRTLDGTTPFVSAIWLINEGTVYAHQLTDVCLEVY